jgi:hypothetical protein
MEHPLKDMVRFAGGRCYVGDAVNLEAPLEAFGQCKLTSSFGELHREQVLFVAAAVGLEVIDGMPYDELRWTASSVLQRRWFEQIPGGVPKGVAVNHEERMTHYQSVLAKVKRGEVMTGEQVAEGGTATSKKSKSAASKAPKQNVTYTYSLSTNTLPERITKGVANEQTTNHDFIIVAIMQKLAKPETLDTITFHVTNTGRYDTKDPMPKSVKWHLAKLEKEGVVIAHEHSVAAASAATTESPVTPADQATNAAPAPKAPKVVKGNAPPRATTAQAAQAAKS